MVFDDVIGQQKVKDLLLEVYAQDKVGHAYLFCGPEGIGRRMVAERFASLVMCRQAEASGNTCGVCPSCVLYRNGTNPDLVIVSEEAGKSSIGIETVRNMQEDMLTAPLYGNKKVYILEHSERLTVQAQNALLKTLEEPPPYVLLILLCTNVSILLDTIRSRLIRVDFVRNTAAEVLQAFRRYYLEERVDERFLCSYADGLIGRALSWKEEGDLERVRSELLSLLCELGRGGQVIRKRLMDLLEKQQAQKDFVFYCMMAYYRDVMLYMRQGRQALLHFEERRQLIVEAGQAIGYYGAARCLRIVEETWRLLDRNVNYKLAMERMLICLQEEKVEKHG